MHYFTRLCPCRLWMLLSLLGKCLWGSVPTWQLRMLNFKMPVDDLQTKHLKTFKHSEPQIKCGACAVYVSYTSDSSAPWVLDNSADKQLTTNLSIWNRQDQRKSKLFMHKWQFFHCLSGKYERWQAALQVKPMTKTPEARQLLPQWCLMYACTFKCG